MDGNVYLSQRLNRYSYVMNSPHQYTDPTGFYGMSVGGLTFANISEAMSVEMMMSGAILDIELAIRNWLNAIDAAIAAGDWHGVESAARDGVYGVQNASRAAIRASTSIVSAQLWAPRDAQLAALAAEGWAMLERPLSQSSAGDWDPIDAELLGIGINRSGRTVPVYEVGLVDFAGGAFMPDIVGYNPRTGTFGNGSPALAVAPWVLAAGGGALSGG